MFRPIVEKKSSKERVHGATSEPDLPLNLHRAKGEISITVLTRKNSTLKIYYFRNLKIISKTKIDSCFPPTLRVQ